MYLTRIHLNYESRKTRVALMNPNLFHLAVEGCFIHGDDPKIRERHLWRIDTLKDKMYLLIISEKKPDLVNIETVYGYGVGSGETKLYDSIKSRLIVDTKWRFRVKANTVKRNGECSVPQTTVGYQKQWFIDKASRFGFSVTDNDFTVVSRGIDSFAKAEGNKKGNKVTLTTATFEGVLTVKDAELFWHTLCNGFGKGKAYGCGMLTIIKI